MNQQEFTERLGALETSVGKVGGETSALLTEVQTLKTAIEALGQLSPEAEAALKRVENRVASVDALVTDLVPAQQP